MKKKNVCMLVAFALVICMALAMAGCANNTVAGKTEPSQSAGNTTQTTEATEATETQPTTAEETEAVEEEETEAGDAEETEPEIDVSLDLEERPSEEEDPEFDEDEANEE